MALENTEVIQNLTKQKEDIETKFEQFASQKQLLEQECERLRIMHGKISGALEVLTQIEDSKVETPEGEEVTAEDAVDAPEAVTEEVSEETAEGSEGPTSRFSAAEEAATV